LRRHYPEHTLSIVHLTRYRSTERAGAPPYTPLSIKLLQHMCDPTPDPPPGGIRVTAAISWTNHIASTVSTWISGCTEHTAPLRSVHAGSLQIPSLTKSLLALLRVTFLDLQCDWDSCAPTTTGLANCEATVVATGTSGLVPIGPS
jgi:hypothetical protein